MNQAETQAILESFLREGFQVVPFPGPADVCVLNTCSVTSMAEAKSRALVRKARRENPASQLVVTGCAAQMRIIASGPRRATRCASSSSTARCRCPR